MSSFPITLVIYGASGDLAARKLIPALYNLFLKERLTHFQVVGLGRTEWSHEQFREEMSRDIQKFAPDVYQPGRWHDFCQKLFYVAGNFTEPADYGRLAQTLAEVETEPAHRLFYLAMPPRFYANIVACLGQSGLVQETSDLWRRVIIEKPFGHDLPSAQELNVNIHHHLTERQIYRIDHYLAKETVQNMMVFRFGNSIFEPLWNRNYIDHVQITAIETVDVGDRASYYDQAGVLRDMFQNHLMQLLSIVAMEPPVSRQATALRNEKVKALTAVRLIDDPAEVAANTIRGQYVGYRQAPGAPADSMTATYSALRLYIDNWRWQGVPFYLRSGKALSEKCTEITIQFKPAPHMLFAQNRRVPGNTLTLAIQPDEAIHLRFEAKIPGTVADLQPVNMHFDYKNSFAKSSIPEAYERLLYDALKGDASLFTRDDEVERAWQIIDPILACWGSPAAPPLAFYKPGSWGPVEADQFLACDGRAWVNKRHAQLEV